MGYPNPGTRNPRILAITAAKLKVTTKKKVVAKKKVAKKVTKKKGKK
jgi:hypothetical protein